MTRAEKTLTRETVATTGEEAMKTYRKAKCYDSQGYLTRSGVTVVLCEDLVMIGHSTYPIDDVTIDRSSREITSPSGWSVTY